MAASDADAAGELADEGGEEEFRAPWHFWVMIAAAVIYLGWRLVEGIWWGIGQLF